MATTPNYATSPKVAFGSFTTPTGTTVYDASNGTVVSLFTVGTSGGRLERLDVEMQGNAGAYGLTNACVVRFFLYDGTTYRMFKEAAFSAVTTAAGVACPTASIVFPDGFPLPAGGFGGVVTPVSVAATITANQNALITALYTEY